MSYFYTYQYPSSVVSAGANANSFLAGFSYFQTVEIEAYTIKIILTPSTTFINSTILSQEKGIAFMNLIGIPLNSQATCIYQATRDGFGANNFHSKVDGILSTYIIIKSTNGNIFGGYTKADWKATTNSYTSDSSAYIFSLVNTYNYPCKLKQVQANSPVSIRSLNEAGPIFGNGYDIFIANQSNSNTNSMSYFYTYQYPSSVVSAGANANSFLAGFSYFQTVEIEAYTINSNIFF
jgi:hypothetical protein